MNAVRPVVVAGVIAAAAALASPAPAHTSCPEGDIIVDAPSTSYWKCTNGTYVWVRTGDDPDSGIGVGNRPGRPGPSPSD
jgi:hypothetical protein